MKEYVAPSLETHLFFGRIMKEHALFLQAAFPAAETEYRDKAEWFREQFEHVLETTVRLANGVASAAVLESGEVFTKYTEMAEKQTAHLTGIPIDCQITQAEKQLKAGIPGTPNRRLVTPVQALNRKALQLLNGLISFKEQILREVTSCRLYTANYPLLIEHILREARLYRQTIVDLEQNGCMSVRDMPSTELFWNQIMMEHAQFIRGLLDPTECDLMKTADTFACDYCRLLEDARAQDCQACEELSKRSLETTVQYQAFKTAGTKGITGCEIRSVILPLLADHVLREANHYLRLLNTSEAAK